MSPIFALVLAVQILRFAEALPPSGSADTTLHPPQSRRVLMVLTGIDRFPGSDRPTGYWAEEFVVPCRIFQRAGLAITTASLRGGLPPVDPASLEGTPGADLRSFLEGNPALLDSRPLSSMEPERFSAVFVVGGHGVLWDLVGAQAMEDLARRTLAGGRVLAAVCHGPAALARVRLSTPAGERYLLGGRRVTGFSNQEESLVGLTGAVPFSLEDALRQASGGLYSAGKPWASHVVVDENLVTGQNPGSSAATAQAVVDRLNFLRR